MIFFDGIVPSLPGNDIGGMRHGGASVRTRTEKTAGGPLTPGHEPSIDELLSDPVAEAIMRCDQITRQDVYRVISKVTAQRAAARSALLQDGRLRDQRREGRILPRSGSGFSKGQQAAE